MKFLKLELPILLYHHIGDKFSEAEKDFCVTTAKFEQQIAYLAKRSYRAIGFDDIKKVNLEHEKYCIISFDDGYENSYTKAYPILEKNGFKATIFIVSNFIGKTNDWDKNSKVSRHKHLSTMQIEELIKNGFSVGSHGCSHRHLLKLSNEEQWYEIHDSKRILEHSLKVPVKVFSYPYNEFNNDIRQIVKDAGYEYACAISTPSRKVMDDPYVLRRIYIKGSDSLLDFKRKISNWYLRYRGLKAH